VAGEQGDEALEVVELGPEGVEQNHDRPGSGLEVSQTRSVRERDERNLTVRAPCARVAFRVGIGHWLILR